MPIIVRFVTFFSDVCIMVSSWDAALQDRVPFISTTITKVWDRLRKVAGLPHLRLYDLRHQFTHSLINNGGTLYEVQQILGHSDSKVTMWCTYLFTKALRETANNAAVKIGA